MRGVGGSRSDRVRWSSLRLATLFALACTSEPAALGPEPAGTTGSGSSAGAPAGAAAPMSSGAPPAVADAGPAPRSDDSVPPPADATAAPPPDAGPAPEPVGTCGPLGRLPRNAAPAVCGELVRWEPPQLVYDGAPTVGQPQVVVVEGGEGFAVAAHFAEAASDAGEGEVRTVLALLDEHGDCRELIGEVEGPTRYITEVRAAGGTTALLTHCSWEAGLACPALVHVGGRAPVDVTADLDVEPPPAGAMVEAEVNHELAVTLDGEVVVVSSKVDPNDPSPEGWVAWVRMRRFSPALEPIDAVSSSPAARLDDIAVMPQGDLLMLMGVQSMTLRLFRYDAAFQLVPTPLVTESVTAIIPRGHLAANDTRVAVASTLVQALDGQTLERLWSDNGVSRASGQALAFVEDDELLYFAAWSLVPRAVLTRFAADGRTLWSVEYSSDYDPTTAGNAVVQPQADGRILASTNAMVLTYCP